MQRLCLLLFLLATCGGTVDSTANLAATSVSLLLRRPS